MLLSTASLLALASCLLCTQKADSGVASWIDAYVDARFEAPPGATGDLLTALRAAGVDTAEELEEALRAPRAEYPDAAEFVGRTTEREIECYHVDYASRYLLYVPEGYDPRVPAPVVLVGHGGNSSMSPQRAHSTAASYLKAYALILSKEMGALVVAPASARGWGHIGNSLLLSTLSDLTRRFAIDPDRVYVTGQSMGGHMSYRAALTLPDRWGAVSPHSGGYDYVEKGAIGSLQNVPGYVTWGKREPYGIREDNVTNAAWAKEHGLDWIFVEKNGGHEIYQDELDEVARFFLDRPRNLYREAVYLRQGGEMKFTRTWGVETWPEHTVLSDTRPLRWNVRHWLEVTPRPDLEGPLLARAVRTGNTIEVTSDRVRELSVYLHPRMVDFDQPVRVVVNGETRFEGRVEPDLALMLDLVREFDDRGRIFWARVTVAVESDREVEPVPDKD